MDNTTLSEQMDALIAATSAGASTCPLCGSPLHITVTSDGYTIARCDACMLAVAY